MRNNVVATTVLHNGFGVTTSTAKSKCEDHDMPSAAFKVSKILQRCITSSHRVWALS
ncbi:hypothetical protein HBI56_199650 [Parastagonospora nodorum]|uniref:Uncharacterized protein n=1 Tax=Phaeosphaeria nodorum (strain SN15 / ATCC MYA-4574 / FGSC 10173) TaxID=321614 RepID=A0A7U2I4R6_PHANO|nr:hypothetical protein HBH56_204650 [Parastagonospora nodorum]QRD01654.1 hypothetical protein JI435_417110 [Parastagonospora nodorum SN15]KAH3923860.1 hypothetical protein HBH54_203530 [Parastagonospora nodorum]KAH3941392.1 hypothetical protein HBH53_200790 [Parastagonospora nodorum]KAH3959618.1 hypothetical protein HBH51_199750 [Parastagonospora nodorum]